MKPIAIIGMGALFPGSTAPDGFWRTITSGRDCMTEVPESHWLTGDYYDPEPARPGKTYVRRGAFLSPIAFEPLENGIPPNVAPSTDTAQLLALLVAKRVLENSCGLQFAHIDRDRVSVILGVASATELVSTMSGSLQRPVLVRALRTSGISEEDAEAVCNRVDASYVDWTESTFPGLLGNVVAGRIANRFDFGGTNCVIDAACASSLGAVQMAMQELWLGSADMVITGGVDAINDIFMYMCFSKTLAMSKSGDCRPFAADADGTMLGEGVGMFALRRLEDAERDGDRIYAVLRGMGASSDGRAKSIYSPRPEGQARALRRAYESAGYGPETVELLEAHGTGTPAGDAAEVKALRDVFESAGAAGRRWCALGSVKSQIGHTKAAAGSASLYKAAMALHHKVLPPTIKVSQPNPALNLDESPFYLNTGMRPWIRGNDHPRRAGVSAFGFGGSNFHLTLEEYRGEAPRPLRIRTLPSELFLASGDDRGQMFRAVREIAKKAQAADCFALASKESQFSFSPDARYRLAIVATGAGDLFSQIERAENAVRGDDPFFLPGGIAFGSGRRSDGGIAFLFPGQGSQYIGMGAGLAMAFDVAREVWDDAATTAPDLPSTVFPPAHWSESERDLQTARLTATENAQPAIGIASRVCLELLRAAGVQPDFLAGHSFGEVTALFGAGVLSGPDFLEVSRKRGQLLAEAAANCPGAMLAVAASAAKLEPFLSGGVTIANINGPNQVVLAGTVAEIEAAEKLLSLRGFAARRLPVSTAFHSPIMASAVAPFTSFLKGIGFGRPSVPVFANSSAQPYPAEADCARRTLANQLVSPVRFHDALEALYAAAARSFIEVGPGSVLTDLASACLDGRPHLAVAMDAKKRDPVTALWFALAKLAAAGIPLDTTFAWRGYEVAPTREAKPSSLAIQITGANYGKKYPPQGEPMEQFEQSMPPVRRPPPELAPLPNRQEASARLEAIAQIHRQMAETHAAAQRAMSESHLAYLRASEAAFAQLDGSETGVSSAVARMELAASRPSPAASAPAAEVETLVAPPAPMVPSPTPAAANHSEDLAELVLTVVAEKTGYPRGILLPDMDLEADLGIDSIKRVQILAAVCDARPDLPAVEAKEMAGLRTLGAIIDYLGHQHGTSGAHVGDMDASQPSPVLFPPHFSINGLARLGTRNVDAPTGSEQGSRVSISRVAVTGPNTQLAAALVECLRRRGIEATVTNTVPPDTDATFFLDACGENDASGDNLPGGILERAERAFEAIRGFAASRGAERGVLVTVEWANSALRGGLAVLARTVSLEFPRCLARSIEMESPEAGIDAVEMIVDEVLSGARAPAVILSPDGSRKVVKEFALPIGHDFDTSLLSDKPVIVVTGGARGVTAACLMALAGTAPVRLALLGRTRLEPEAPGFESAKSEAELRAALFAAERAQGKPVSPRDIDARARRMLAVREVECSLRQLRELGAEAEYFAADVTNAAAVDQAFAAVRIRWGRVDGLIHAAGVVADKQILEKSPEQFARVFGTKVIGFEALLRAARCDELRFIYVFSSVAGRYGNSGQADYAMANAVMSRMAREEAARRSPGCVVRALSWGPWEGGMVTPELRSHFAARGVPLISMDRGVAAFMQEFCHTSTDPEGIDVVLAAHTPSRHSGDYSGE